jgi:hypothetical protein
MADSNNCKRNIGPRLKSPPGSIFFAIQICTQCGFLYEFIKMNSYNCYTNCIVRKLSRCGFHTNSYNFYTNSIVRIHTRCDLFICKPRACSAASAQREPRVCRASREGKAQAASAQHEPRGRSPSCKRASRAARAKPELQARSASREG